MRIVVLTSETPGNTWLVNRILERHEVAGVVIERRPLASDGAEKRARRRRMLRRHGAARTLNKLAYSWLRSRLLSRADGPAAREAFFPGGAPVAFAREVPTRVVPSVNDAGCVEFVRGLAPELLAVCGTGVIRPEVFSLAPRGAINIHTGITPEYKSADPIFWALYRGEPENVGVTVHFVDAGIDTGPILRQAVVPVYAGDRLGTISERCIRRGADLYLEALDAVAAGNPRTVDRPGAQSRSFRSVDLGIVEYLRFRLRWRRLARRLPPAPPAPVRADGGRGGT